MTVQDSGSLIGTWKLVAIQFEFADTGERCDMYGPQPLGFLIMTEGGRMMGLLTSSERAPPKEPVDGAALFNSMMAYSGRFRIEGGDKFVTMVDVSWHPAWNGTEQVRSFSCNGDELSIRSSATTHPMFPGKGDVRCSMTERGIITGYAAIAKCTGAANTPC